MFHIQSQTIVTVCIILNINCERWYSATLFDKIDKTESKISNHSRMHYAFDDVRDLIPISKYEYKEELNKNGLSKIQHRESESKKRWSEAVHRTKIHGAEFKSPHVYGASDPYISQHDNFKNNSRKPQEVLSYNNNVNVVNVITRKKPKRKIIKRPCPNINTRKSKGMYSKQSRFLEVFHVVEFEHVACVSSSGLEGTCLHEYECESNGGSMMGTCADGYGTCCVTQYLCDGQTSDSVGWFTNPGYPSPSSERLSCTLTLNKASDDIKQIRLDFVAFELLGPTGGTCQQDQFIIYGQNENSILPIFCGINTGQHVYMEVGDVEGPVFLSVQTFTPENRLFAIKVSQLTWAEELAAPSGCLQYFTEAQGSFESFNYKDKTEIGITRTPSYLNNLNYAICIRRSQNTCSVTYTNEDYMQIVNYDLEGLPVIPKGQAGVEIYNCPSDWLLISATRLCGDKLNDGSILQDFSLDAPVTDNSAGPITVWFRSDEGYVGRGFKLQYKQNICNNPD